MEKLEKWLSAEKLIPQVLIWRRLLNCCIRISILLIVSIIFNLLFLIVLGDLYARKASNAKIEKLLAQQVKDKLRDMSLDIKIQSSFDQIN